MIDFENREYLRIAAYWKDWAVCFVMKNGLAYMVSTKKGRNFKGIPVAICSGSHTKMNPYLDDMTTITQAELQDAIYNLHHEELRGYKSFQAHSDEVEKTWLKWTNKYRAVIDDLALYYAEKMAHCPSPAAAIKIDFENREYVEVAGYWPESYVCFVMKNGLSYCVGLERKEIIIDVHPYAHFNDYGAFFEEADKIAKTDLKKAVKILQTAKLPELGNEEVKAFQFWLQMYKDRV